MEKINAVKEWRSKSSRKNTVELAETPTLFAEIRQPNSSYLAIPTVCSEKRSYVPLGFLSSDVIASNQVYVLPNATLYHFGVLTSSVHNSWMRAVCGRLEMRYRYSNSIVYNNFVWCEPTDAQRQQIETTAQGILDARAKYEGATLANLYDEKTAVLYGDLRKAHQANDQAVISAYGWAKDITETEIVAKLMALYQEMVNGK